MGQVRTLRGVVGLILGTVVAGCSSSGGSTGPGPTPSISLSLSPTSASVLQGGSTIVTATLTRSGGFSGTVDLTVTGAPAGVTGTIGAPQTSGGSTTAPVTVAVAASVAAGNYTLTVTGTGSGVSNATATFSLTVTVGGNFSLAATALSIAAGANGNSTVTITRTGGFSGSVALTATAVPAGLSAQFAPASTTGNTSTLTITATAGLAPGNYTVGITGSASGLPDQTASVAVTVTAPSGSGNVQISLACFAPIWVAYQDGTGAWTRATTVSPNVYRISVTGNYAGVALVFPSGGGFQTQINYLPKAYLTSAATVNFCAAGGLPPGTKSVSGTAAGLTGSDRANISMGGSTGLASTNNLNFGLNQVQNGPQDLIGWRHDPAGESNGHPNPDRGLLRRDQNIPNLGSVGIVDLTGSESFAPATATITLPGTLAGEKLTHAMQYLTRPECVLSALYQTSAGDPSPFTATGIPGSLQRTDDYHYLIVSAVTGSGTPIIGHTSSRTYSTVFHTLTNQAVTLPPSIAGTTVTTLAGPYKRLQAVIPTVPAFAPGGGLTYISQAPLRLVALVYAGSVFSGSQVTLAMPDFTGLAGFDPTWLPATSATGTWSAQVAGTNNLGSTLCNAGTSLWSAAALGTF